MTYALKTHRLITSRKLTDRYLACQIHHSSEEKEGYAGCLFSLVEILNPWYPTSQIGQTVINTVAREYFRAKEPTALENFEFAIKRTNETLTQYTQNGETDWIGNLHGAFALIYNHEIHISTVGKPYIYLFRDGKIIDIVEQSNEGSQEEIHPLRPFANITSGEIKQGDILVIASSELAAALTAKQIQETAEINPLDEASLQLANHVRGQRISNVNILLVEVSTKEDIANEPVSNIPETIPLDNINEPIILRTRLFIKQKITPHLKKIAGVISAAFLATGLWLRQRGLPVTKKALTATGKGIQKTSQTTKSMLRPSPPASSNSNDMEIIQEGMPPLVGASVHIRNYRDKPFRHRLRQGGNIFSRFAVSSFNYLRLLITDRRYRPRLYRTLIILAILFLGVSMIIKTSGLRQGKPGSNVKYQLSTLQAKYDMSGNVEPAQAIPLLNEIITTISRQDKPKGSSLTLLNSAKERLNTLTHTTSLSVPSSAITLPKATQNIYVIGNNIYAITKQDGIYSGSLSSPTLELAANFPANTGSVLASTGPNSAKTIFILTSNSALYEFSTDKTQLKPASSSDASWKAAVSLSHFGNSIYFLDNKEGKIWKYTANQAKFSSPVSYTTDSQARLTEAKSLAIDGKVYVLRNDGSLIEAGKKTNTPITLSGFPTDNQKPKTPVRLITNEENDLLFLVEKNRLLAFSKTGVYDSEYILSDNSAAITDVFVQPTLHKIWLASGNKLFSFSY